MKNLYLGLTLIILASACTNFGGVPQALDSGSGGSGGFNSTGTKLTITNVSTSTGQNGTIFNVNFRAQSNDPPITRFCRVGTTQGSSAQPCSIKYEWKEANQKTSQTIIIPRGSRSPLESSQSYLVTAEAPSAYDEIAKGTPISITVVSDTSGNANFQMEPFIVRKGLSSKDPGDIEDELGNVLHNVFEYSCFDKSTKALEVKSRGIELENSNGPQPERITGLLASNFCARGITDNVEGCENAEGVGESSENFYYNLSIPSTRSGITLSNEAYTCPKVRENLNSNTSAPDFWPGQTVYALATRVSAEFNVPVEAPAILGDGTTGTSPTKCLLTGEEAEDPVAGSTTSISSQCIGFAKSPSTDGSCPSFKDKNGVIVPTFPLKRYVYDHGPRSNADGKIKEEARALDIVYVINRPVRTNNPLSTVSIRGPVPCDQAYLDHAGATQAGTSQTVTYNSTTTSLSNLYDPELNMGMPAYRGRNRDEWALTNVDGIHFPAIDSWEQQSCGTSFPIFKIQNGAIETASFATSNQTATQSIDLGGGRSLSLKRIYVRPKDPIKRQWILDDSFQACAPLAQPFREAPLHFAKTADGDVAWCSERYPTQNSQIELIDDIKGNTNTQLLRPGYVTPFTSHVEKKTLGDECSYSLPREQMPSTSIYPLPPSGPQCSPTSVEFVQGAGYHPDTLRVDFTAPSAAVCADKTCDRTITNLNSSNFRVPLLANAEDTEKLIRTAKRPKAKSDFTYVCSIEGDSAGGKNGQSPSGGCCKAGVIQFPPGVVPLDSSSTAHLEPETACGTPDY